jgi:DNA-binding SARP family transcriptional activator
MMGVRFRLLGPLHVSRDNTVLTPTAPKLRAVLALLVLRHNRLVQTWELVDELWGEAPPRSAHATLQTYIYKLRKLLGQLCDGSAMLHTEAYGYRAAIPSQDIDVWRFLQLAEQGRVALERGDAEQAADLCAQALAFWRGPALAGVSIGGLLAAQAVRLEEERLRTLEARIEADLLLGRHRRCVGELMELTRTHLVHEGFCRQLMLALYRSDRRGEALAEYQRLRRLMVDEFALEPSARIQRVHRALLAEDLGLEIGAQFEEMRQAGV